MICWLRTFGGRRHADEAARREAKADYREAVIDVRDQRIAELERENATLKTDLAALLMLQWMYAAIIQRDRVAKAERARAERLQRIADEPTGVYATEQFRRIP